MRDLTSWTNLTKAAVRGVTDTDAAAIGAMCFAAEQRGENCSVWHQSSLHYGHRCPCAQCCPPKRAGH